MADAGRTLCVRGLPGGIAPERLADKLQIHFLSARNGGGEITSITVNERDRLALITFEDITVALSVLRHCPHIFEVDGRKYKIALSFPWQTSVHPNKAEHPNPGSPFQGGIFDTYLPLSTKGQGLLRCLEKAFKQGLTFTICPGDMKGYRSARIVWDRIPHKMNMEGGRSRNGYPDSTYLNDLAEALKASRIEEAILNEN
ncbi:probable E3 ubiquitin-protein ligase DTX2 isoform X3 [Electrophorus electricus]|uniref:probable E3 ubiquitin-protein ligase DTX2 isoform X3 n=1 Tax=Electrophorus electricus TaxID=8005 RepID=UPI0015D04AF0|nr:probable E3 ubiquitin-protein ligase DTX2 isoform X3 [Electrophorus electricus]